MDVLRNVLRVGLASGGADVVRPSDIERQRCVLGSERYEVTTKPEVHPAATRKAGYDATFFACHALAVALWFQLGRASRLVLAVNSSNINRLPTIWRTAASNLSPSSMSFR